MTNLFFIRFVYENLLNHSSAILYFRLELFAIALYYFHKFRKLLLSLLIQFYNIINIKFRE
jgi:hypothetical protein